MLRDKVREYYLEGGYNCAETMLKCINEEYDLGLTAEDLTLVSAFGGGMASGHVCGALAGAMAGLGRLLVSGKAHGTPGFGEVCKAYVAAFEEKLGHTMCSEIVKTHKKPDVRCLEAVELAADLFEDFYADLKAKG